MSRSFAEIEKILTTEQSSPLFMTAARELLEMHKELRYRLRLSLEQIQNDIQQKTEALLKSKPW